MTFQEGERIESYNIVTGFLHGPFPKVVLRVGQIRQIDVFEERVKVLRHFAAEIIKEGVYDGERYWIGMTIDDHPGMALFSVSESYWVHWTTGSRNVSTARVGKNLPWRRSKTIT